MRDSWGHSDTGSVKVLGQKTLPMYKTKSRVKRSGWVTARIGGLASGEAAKIYYKGNLVRSGKATTAWGVLGELPCRPISRPEADRRPTASSATSVGGRPPSGSCDDLRPLTSGRSGRRGTRRGGRAGRALLRALQLLRCARGRASTWWSTSTASVAASRRAATRVGRAGRATRSFPRQASALTYAQREPGFVCRVKNAPQQRPVRERLPDQCLLGSLLVQRQVRQVDLLVLGRRRDQRAEWRLPRVLLAERRERRPARSRACEQPASTGHQGADQDRRPRRRRRRRRASRTRTRGRPVPRRPTKPRPTSPPRRKAAAGASPQKKAAKAKRARRRSRPRQRPRQRRRRVHPLRRAAPPRSRLRSTPRMRPRRMSRVPRQVDSAFAPEEEQNGLPVVGAGPGVLALAGAAGGTAWWRRRTGAP